MKGGDPLDTQITQNPSSSQALRILRNKMKDGTLRAFFRDWKWIFSFSRSHWFRILIYTLLGITASALGLVTGVAGKYLIDCIVSMDKQQLPLLAGVMVLSSAASLALHSITSRFSARLGVSMHNSVQSRVFENLLRSRWLEIRRFPTGDLLNRFSVDINTVSGCAVSWLPSVVIQLFTLLASLLVVLYYDPVMALIAFASTPALIFASRRLLRKQRYFGQQMRSVSSGMSVFEAETFRNIDTLKSFGAEVIRRLNF